MHLPPELKGLVLKILVLFLAPNSDPNRPEIRKVLSSLPPYLLDVLADMVPLIAPELRYGWFLLLLKRTFPSDIAQRVLLTEGASLRLVPEPHVSNATMRLQNLSDPKTDFRALCEALKQESPRAYHILMLQGDVRAGDLDRKNTLGIEPLPPQFPAYPNYGVNAVGDVDCPVTILMASNKPSYTKIWADFHRTLPLKIVISLESEPNFEVPDNVTVVVGTTYSERLHRAAIASDTKYSLITGDDDFIHLPGIAQAVERLESDTEITAIDGRSLDVSETHGGRYYLVYRQPVQAEGLDFETRMAEFFTLSSTVSTALRRTETLQAALGAFQSDPRVLPRLVEVMMDYTGLVEGPVGSIGTPLYIRSRLPTKIASPLSATEVSVAEQMMFEETPIAAAFLGVCEEFHRRAGTQFDAAAAKKFIALWLGMNLMKGNRRRAFCEFGPRRAFDMTSLNSIEQYIGPEIEGFLDCVVTTLHRDYAALS